MTTKKTRPAAIADPQPDADVHPIRGYQRRPLWHASIPPLAAHDGRPLPEQADVVVVGGGYTGLSAALGLVRSGARVVVLERERLGWGASTRNGGIVHAGLKWGHARLRRMFGAELGERVYRAGIENFFEFERFIEVEDLATDYRRTGLIVLAWSRRHLEGLREEAAELATGGLHGRVVSGSELLDEIGTNHYPGGLVVEEAGAIHPGRYFAALAGAVSEAGADLYPETPALAIERGGGGLAVRTPRGSIACRDVLLATNGYTDRLLPWLRRRVIPVGSYIIATEPLDEQTAAAISPRGRVFFDSKNFLYYWRLGPDRRLLFGGRASFTPTSVDRTAAILRQAMHRVHPQTRRLRIEYAWGGNVGFTFDRLPHIGRHEGISYALGYCGSGVAMATSFGLYMARRLGERSEVAAERSPFEEITHPGVPLVPAVYRERPWFLPPAGELFRAVDWWSRRDLPTR